MAIGGSRYVLCLKPLGVAVKLPRLGRFGRGAHCNRWEREMWRAWRPRFGWQSLCPIIFADRVGLVVVMRLAREMATQEEADEAYPHEFHRITSEGKPDDYRRLGNRIVVVDYGLESEAAANEQRAYYLELLARK